MTTDNNSGNAAAPAGPAMLPVQAQALNDAINALPLETLQAERAELVKLHRDTSAFDAAIAAKGGAPTNAAVVKDHVAHGVAVGEGKPDDYSGANYGALRDLPPERLAAVKSETGAWAAALGMSKDAGTALLERLAEIGPRIGKMDANERANWLEAQDRVTTRVAGGDKGLKDLVAKATALLEARTGNSDITKGLLQSVALRDPVILRMLANHADALKMMATKYPKR